MLLIKLQIRKLPNTMTSTMTLMTDSLMMVKFKMMMVLAQNLICRNNSRILAQTNSKISTQN